MLTVDNAPQAVWLALALLVWQFFAIRSLRRRLESRHWPSTPGTIEAVKVDRVKRFSQWNPVPQRGAFITYRYRVGSSTLRASGIGGFQESFLADAEAVAARYPVGRQVTVYYDPARPENALLCPGAISADWIFAGTPFVALLALVWWVVLP